MTHPGAAKAGNDFEVEETFPTEKFFDRKHVSDYPQATDIIQRSLAKMSTSRRGANLGLDDIDVVVGPWTDVGMGLGGYLGSRRARERNIPLPLKPVPGIEINPPVILIDDAQYPSVGDRNHIIIHEFRHHINEKLWVESPQYETPAGRETEEDLLKWEAYLDSPDERLAHKI